jgi:CRISPR system Cascade subunit CasE
MIASVLRLTRSDIKALRVTDAYSLHRVVYNLFDDVRSDSEKQASIPSGILYVDKGGDWDSRRILMLSNRSPNIPVHGSVESKPIPESFLHHNLYRFEVTINPTKRDKSTGKIIAIRERELVRQWFIDKASKSWGFTVNERSLQVEKIDVKTFDKKGHTVTQGSAILIGILNVSDRDLFIQSFQKGIGRGRAFGFGLLQIVPLTKI